MKRQRVVFWAIFWSQVCSIGHFPAQGQPVSGLYQIVSGNYSTCCGIGGELRSALPNESQSFVRLRVDSTSGLAGLTFLDAQMQPVFSTVPCPPGDAIPFSFEYGFVSSNSIFFHADPGPPPEYKYWNYTVSNSAAALRVDGVVGIAPGFCADVPNHFSHSNVVAVLVPEPKVAITELSSEGPLLFVQGPGGRTNVVEASDDLAHWTPIITNVMPNTLCPVCPYLSFRDRTATNLSTRFYRFLMTP